MNKKIVSLILLACITVSVCGCTGAWRRKFVRTKKGEVREGPVLQPTDYSKEFTNKQFYANHFAFWKNSEAELISCIESQKSLKRTLLYTNYSLTELKELRTLLIDAKKLEIMPYVDELEDIASKIKEESYLNAHKNMLADTLRKHLRNVARKFSYYAMREYIKEDNPPQAE